MNFYVVKSFKAKIQKFVYGNVIWRDVLDNSLDGCYGQQIKVCRNYYNYETFQLDLFKCDGCGIWYGFFKPLFEENLLLNLLRMFWGRHVQFHAIGI